MTALSERQRETLLWKYVRKFLIEPLVPWRRQPYCRLNGRGVIPDVLFRFEKTNTLVVVELKARNARLVDVRQADRNRAAMELRHNGPCRALLIAEAVPDRCRQLAERLNVEWLEIDNVKFHQVARMKRERLSRRKRAMRATVPGAPTLERQAQRNPARYDSDAFEFFDRARSGFVTRHMIEEELRNRGVLDPKQRACHILRFLFKGVRRKGGARTDIAA